MRNTAGRKTATVPGVAIHALGAAVEAVPMDDGEKDRARDLVAIDRTRGADPEALGKLEVVMLAALQDLLHAAALEAKAHVLHRPDREAEARIRTRGLAAEVLEETSLPVRALQGHAAEVRALHQK